MVTNNDRRPSQMFKYSFKISMDYNGKDFDGDRVQQYATLRVEIAKKNGEECFGLAEHTHFLHDHEMTMQERKQQKDKVKASKGLIRTGYNRILEKFKEVKMAELY